MENDVGGERKTPLTDALAGDVSGGFGNEGLHKRLARYAVAHARTLAVSDYISTEGGVQHSKLAALLHGCGSYLLFHNYYRLDQVRLAAANFCNKHLLCPLCAIRRGAKTLGQYHKRWLALSAENPRLRPYLVTLTVKNGEDLQERYSHLHNSLRRYNQQRSDAKKGRRSAVEFSKAEGAVCSFEFKRGKNSGMWHPHCHGIWLCETAPDPVALSDDWLAVTGDSHIVDVREIDTTNEAGVGGFLEVFKYAVKFADLPFQDNFEGYLTLSGRRMIASYGIFRGVEIPESLCDDLMPEDEPYIELYFRYQDGRYRQAAPGF